HENGAYTGDISGSMLAKLGCGYVVVGHSERRQYHAEGDDIVNAKAKAAYAHGLTPIVCVGEDLATREGGEAITHACAQLVAAVKGLSPEQASSIVIAYEPIWAIGTGKVATPEDAQEMCSALRAVLAELYSDELAGAVRLLYGGSVKGGNAAQMLVQPDVDGALVGGASLDGAEFAAICVAAIPRSGD
ncbi:MAG TPA: triose-phosphate isomerase, partial [Jatrophihabitantaceae bacterium]|nr:triose-phosphate isomerase [Jatrophihabitantaceae bacterium]